MRLFTRAASIFRVLESDGHSDTSGRPISKWTALCAEIRYQWGFSLLRIVLAVFCNLPQRIAAIRKNPDLRFGVPIPFSPSGRSPASVSPENSFLHACTQDIAELQNRVQWLGVGELEQCAAAYQRGAQWGLSNPHVCSGKEDGGA